MLEFVEESLDEIALAIKAKSHGSGIARRGWEGITGVICRSARVLMKVSAS
jgi:hypothetical protein